MRPVLALLLVACSHAPPPPTTPIAAVAPAVAPAPPTEAEITKLSHDLLDAYDRGDVPATEAALAAELVHFEGGKPVDRDNELAGMRKRKPGGAFIEKRTWDEEHVRIHGNSAVFIGKASETQGGNKSKGGYKYTGWYVLEWVRGGAAWKLRLWTWQRAGEQSQRDTWNDIFRNGVGFLREPNKLLVETMKGKKPGTALDVAMGQGRNALFLASQGWKVTGVDISDEGIRIAREEAARRKLAVDMVNTNIDTYEFGTNRWDLVTMIYATANVAWIEKIKPSLKPGGLFVLEFFANDGTDDGGFKPGQLAKLFEGFEILRDDTVDDAPDWALDRAKLVRFVAKKR
jgi:SAM-dependent methyltransferase